MKCRGKFVFKSVSRRVGGTFTNSEGKDISYEDAYVIRADEETDTGIQERKFKFPCTNKKLYEDLHLLAPYTRIELEFDVSLYNNQARLLPISLVEE